MTQFCQLWKCFTQDLAIQNIVLARCASEDGSGGILDGRAGRVSMIMLNKAGEK
ncbi:MAG: hypothetical protein H6Q67_2204 [Firmicutes bacterium]|nr:hypothetical protein [Bacillota bacterium]